MDFQDRPVTPGRLTSDPGQCGAAVRARPSARQPGEAATTAESRNVRWFDTVGIENIPLVGGLGEARAATATDEPVIAGPGMVSLTLKVNGRDYELNVEPRVTLAEILRDGLDLTGTKIGCDRGSRSACGVWLDGAPDESCMLLAIDAGGHAITTIEGPAQGDTLHPVQGAFIAHDAM
jgi:hypothetical protein